MSSSAVPVKGGDSSSRSAVQQHDALLETLGEQWKNEMNGGKGKNKGKKSGDDDDDADYDETDALLDEAIAMAIRDGKGWSDGEKEAYMAQISDDDYIPPLFASTPEELERSGLTEAFTSLVYDDPPAKLMLDFKAKGNEAFRLGKQNVAKNVQYYRDAVNHYYEALAWAEKLDVVVVVDSQALSSEGADSVTVDQDDVPVYTEEALEEMKSTLYANVAMAHFQLKNWGYVRDNCKKALDHNDRNVKACFRLAKAYQMLSNWEEAGDAIDRGLGIDPENGDLRKLQNTLRKHVTRARALRQKREKARLERLQTIKKVWKRCRDTGTRLGRVPLVSTVTNDERMEEDDDDDADRQEARWHHHHPHSGKLPQPITDGSGNGNGNGNDELWAWPCMFVYPSHNQSDFIQSFPEDDMLAVHMAQVLPEIEDDNDNGNTAGETTMPWDYNNEFVCSQLAVYFEVHCADAKIDDAHTEPVVYHPEYVRPLEDQASAIKFYEAARALRGDEGADMAHLAGCFERKQLHQQRKAWKRRHGSLWARPDPCPVVRVHPAATLRDVLADPRMIVPNFLVTFVMFPMNHPAHEEFLKTHQCLGLLEHKEK